MKFTRENAAMMARKGRAKKAARTRLARYGIEGLTGALRLNHQYGKQIKRLRNAIKALETPNLKHQQSRCFCPYHTASEYLFNIQAIHDAINKLEAECKIELAAMRRRLSQRKHEAALARLR